MSTAENKPKMLLIWDESPEKHTFYELERDSQQAKWARGSMNCYINGDDLDDDHPIHQLCEWLNTPEAKDSEINTEDNKSIRGKFSEIVICGFFL